MSKININFFNPNWMLNIFMLTMCLENQCFLRKLQKTYFLRKLQKKLFWGAFDHFLGKGGVLRKKLM